MILAWSGLVRAPSSQLSRISRGPSMTHGGSFNSLVLPEVEFDELFSVAVDHFEGVLGPDELNVIRVLAEHRTDSRTTWLRAFDILRDANLSGDSIRRRGATIVRRDHVLSKFYTGDAAPKSKDQNWLRFKILMRTIGIRTKLTEDEMEKYVGLRGELRDGPGIVVDSEAGEFILESCLDISTALREPHEIRPGRTYTIKATGRHVEALMENTRDPELLKRLSEIWLVVGMPWIGPDE